MIFSSINIPQIENGQSLYCRRSRFNSRQGYSLRFTTLTPLTTSSSSLSHLHSLETENNNKELQQQQLPESLNLEFNNNYSSQKENIITPSENQLMQSIFSSSPTSKTINHDEAQWLFKMLSKNQPIMDTPNAATHPLKMANPAPSMVIPLATPIEETLQSFDSCDERRPSNSQAAKTLLQMGPSSTYCSQLATPVETLYEDFSDREEGLTLSYGPSSESEADDLLKIIQESLNTTTVEPENLDFNQESLQAQSTLQGMADQGSLNGSNLEALAMDNLIQSLSNGIEGQDFTGVLNPMNQDLFSSQISMETTDTPLEMGSLNNLLSTENSRLSFGEETSFSSSSASTMFNPGTANGLMNETTSNAAFDLTSHLFNLQAPSPPLQAQEQPFYPDLSNLVNDLSMINSQTALGLQNQVTNSTTNSTTNVNALIDYLLGNPLSNELEKSQMVEPMTKSSNNDFSRSENNETQSLVDELLNKISIQKSENKEDIVDISEWINNSNNNSNSNQGIEDLNNFDDVIEDLMNSDTLLDDNYVNEEAIKKYTQMLFNPAAPSSTLDKKSDGVAMKGKAVSIPQTAESEMNMFPKVEELMNCQVDEVKFSFSEENISKLAKSAPFEIDQKEMEVIEEQCSQKRGKGRPRKPKRFYCCPFNKCGKKFNREFNLKDHIRTHNKNRSKEFECPVCKECFYRPMELRRHHSSVHEEKKFTCQSCGKKFGRKDALRRHELDSCYFNFMKKL